MTSTSSEVIIDDISAMIFHASSLGICETPMQYQVIKFTWSITSETKIFHVLIFRFFHHTMQLHGLNFDDEFLCMDFHAVNFLHLK